MTVQVLRSALRSGLPGRLSIARCCSDVLSPPLLSAVGLALVASHGASWGAALLWTLGLAALIVLAPVLSIVWMLHRGTIDDIHLPCRKDRLAPGLIALAGLLLGLALVWALPAPALLLPFLLTQLLTQLLLLLVTLRWQISYHAAAAGGLCALGLALHGLALWPLGLLLPLVGWARIALRRHSWGQVLAGSASGALLLLGCFSALA